MSQAQSPKLRAYELPDPGPSAPAPHYDDLVAALGQAQADEVLREYERAEKMAQIAKYRYHIARHHHRLQNGKPLDFERYPYQEEIYQCDAHSLVIVGAVQWGKSEYLLITAAAMAGLGLRVFFVFSKIEKRNKIVADRVDPAFKLVPLYRAMSEGARKERKAEADSTGLKHFGKGGINFVGSNSAKDFTSFSADATFIDEHQECDPENISGVFERMSGSPYRFQIIVGNPRLVGTAENQNLDWQYRQSDQRQWHVPCETCGHLQVLDWWQHFVLEEKNKSGAILSVRPRDLDWDPNGVLDMRPICVHCNRPMNRLSRDGRWAAHNPGHRRRGYQLSNLYNVNVRMGGPDSLFERYMAAQYSPSAMAKFINDQLGLAWSQEGTQITEQMLAQVSKGDLCGIDPYVFQGIEQMEFEPLAEAA